MIIQRISYLSAWTVGLFKQAASEITLTQMLLFLVAYVAIKAINRVYFSPLSNIPGPFLNAISGIPLLYHLTTGNYPRYIINLHKKYGPIVRTGHDKIAISDNADVRRVLATHNFRKSMRYEHGYTICVDIFSTTDPELNKKRRRQLGDAYAKHSIWQMEDTILDYGVRALKQKWDHDIERAGGKMCRINYYFNFQTLAYDIIGILGFGENFGSISRNDTKVTDWALKALSMMGLLRIFPYLRPVSWIFPDLNKGFNSLIQHTIDAVERRKAYLKENKGPPPNDVLQRLVNAALNPINDQMRLSDKELYAETLIVLLGGSETTSNTLSWIIASLLNNPEVYKRAVNEVRTVFPNKSQDIRYEETMSKLPYLSAVIYETMRMMPVSAASIPRVTPKGGTTIQGHYIPQGTYVNVSISSCGRDPSVWKNPDVFDPTRFLGPDGERLSKELMVFSSGVRSCVGRHLARMEVFTVIPNLLRDYDFSLPEDHLYGPSRKPNSVPNCSLYPVDIPCKCISILTPVSPNTDCWINIKRAE